METETENSHLLFCSCDVKKLVRLICNCMYARSCKSNASISLENEAYAMKGYDECLHWLIFYYLSPSKSQELHYKERPSISENLRESSSFVAFVWHPSTMNQIVPLYLNRMVELLFSAVIRPPVFVVQRLWCSVVQNANLGQTQLFRSAPIFNVYNVPAVYLHHKNVPAPQKMHYKIGLS